METGFSAPPQGYSELEGAAPRAILGWAAEAVDRLAVATSFQSSGLVILHQLRDLRPDIPVLFLDTGWHFPETLQFRDRVISDWGLKLVELRGRHGSAAEQDRLYGEELYKRDPDQCCHINKVEPLQEALEGFDAWISGIRRDQSPLRSGTPVIEAQLLPSGREILKLHPLAAWTKNDVAEYIREHEIPTHPLLERGFASIGCWPCTRAVNSDEGERAGRWDGFTKTECGIHSFGKGRTTEADQ
ncbi:MAG: phosphoadenylyl-sulfate reductase [Actinomycetota bacterium]|nr:phosphoadenylyl-sulfate reductase [Actinomycetota bacterium]